MNIKDFLRYYIGQQVRFRYKGSVHFMEWQILEWGEEINDPDCTGIQLALRRIEDMTEEDMKDIWLIIVGRPFTGRIQWIDKETQSSCKRWCMMSGLDRVGIELNGNVWADCDLNHIKFNPHLISHYLLSRGFDLFGLIEAGLAIDSKTVTI